MKGIVKPRKIFNLFVSHLNHAISPMPKNPMLALSDPNWKSAMQSEFDALIRNKTWDFVILTDQIMCVVCENPFMV
jgi:hypothetical protein